MDRIKILQVVGYKNSGKTTLLSRWTHLATKAGKKVAVIKHHGHDHPLELPPQKTDSMNYLANGAVSSAVIGGGLLQLHMDSSDVQLDKLLELMKFSNPDYIFIEGFKEAAYDKVVLVRSTEDWSKLQELTEIICVVTHDGVTIEHESWLEQADEATIDHWFCEWMRCEH